MKTTILALMCLILTVGCNKQSPQPAPVQPAPPPNTNNINNCSAQEQVLLGRWLADSSVLYSGNIREQCLPQTDTFTCKIVFESAACTQDPSRKGGTFGHQNCTFIYKPWEAPNNGYVNINGQNHGIILQTSTNLVLTFNNWKYYLHR